MAKKASAKPDGLAIANALELKNCEGRIQTAIDGAREHWAAIGRELVAIRDGKLYAGKFKTFEAYCLERWEFTRGHAYRLMDAVKVIEDLSPQGGAAAPDDFPGSGRPVIPETERQARAVGAAAPDPETRREVWNTAQELAGDPQPAPRVIGQAAEVVQTGKPANHESIELTESIRHFSNTVKLLEKRGKEIQTALGAKVNVCQAMQTRKVKFERLIGNMAAQVDLLKEHIDGLEKAWASTRKQVDDD